MHREICPICNNECDDMRHVSVECFYAVDEYVPEAKVEPFFCEVDEEVSYFGTTRRYKEGTRDQFDRQKPNDSNVIKITTTQVPIDPIRLLEKSLYCVNCCKGCRHEFLSLFSAWYKGKFVQHSESETEGIRELTPEEVEQLKKRKKDGLMSSL